MTEEIPDEKPRSYYQAHKEHLRAYLKKWRKSHYSDREKRQKLYDYINEWRRKKYAENPEWRIKEIERTKKRLAQRQQKERGIT